MRTFVSMGALLVALSGSVEALAASASALRGTRVVVPVAVGSANSRAKTLTNSLRKELRKSLGPLVPSRDVRRPRRPGGEPDPDQIAQRARGTEAEYILAVDITKKGRMYTARGVLVSVENGDLLMNFRSQYFRPATQAADRGRRIARRTIERLLELQDEERAPMAVAEDRPGERDGAFPPADPGAGGSAAPLASASDSSAREPQHPTSTAGGPPSTSGGATSASSGPFTAAPTRSPEANSASSPKPWETPSTGAIQEAPVAEPRSRYREVLRATVGGGAGVLRRYDLSANAVSSSLSYQLAALGLVNGELEAQPLDVPFALRLAVAWRPVRFQVNLPDESPVVTRGSLVDTTALLAFPIRLSRGAAGPGIRLTPAAGLRVNVAKVAVHRGNRVLSSSALTPTLAARLDLPLNELFEVTLGFDGGYVAGYKETPTTNGDPDGGISLGGDLVFRIWIAHALGVAITTRVDHQSLRFHGRAKRQVPANMGELVDAALRTFDLNVSAGVALRF